MKKLFLLLLLISCAVAEDRIVGPLPAGEKVGRFRVVSCNYSNGTVDVRSVMRVDTTTGKTWILMPITDGRLTVVSWSAVTESAETALKQGAEMLKGLQLPDR